MLKEWLKQHNVLQRMRDTRLHPLQRVAVVGLVLLVGLSFSIGSVTTLLQKQVDILLSAVLPGVIVELTNVERSAEDLGTLSRNTVLDEAAYLKAEHMIEHEYFSHFSPKDNISPWYWFDLAEYDYVHAGENLAIYFSESEDVVEAWMNSPLHKENILKAEYTEIGVAAVAGTYDGHDTVYVVQLFGTPAAQPTPPAEEVLLVVEPSAEDEQDDNTQAIQGETTEQVEEVVETKPLPEEEKEEEDKPSILPVPVGNSIGFMTDHVSTSTGKAAAAPAVLRAPKDTDYSPRSPASGTKTVLQLFYAFLAVVVAGVVVVSIVLTEKRAQHVQAFYGIGLLLLVMTAVFIHTKVVMAAVSLI